MASTDVPPVKVKRKPGTECEVSLLTLTKPMEGRLITITFNDEEPVKCRVMKVESTGAKLKVVENSVKE